MALPPASTRLFLAGQRRITLLSPRRKMVAGQSSKKLKSWRKAMSSPAPVNRRTLLTMIGGSIATQLVAPRNALAQEA